MSNHLERSNLSKVYSAQVSTRVQPGNCFAPFHWNDQFDENLAVNAATSGAVDPTALQPEFKFCAVALTKMPVDLQADFTPPQKNYLQKFLAEQPTSTAQRFQIPDASPFSPNQRGYINEALARLMARNGSDRGKYFRRQKLLPYYRRESSPSFHFARA